MSEKINVLKIESPDIGFGPLLLKSVKDLTDVESTLGVFLCEPGDEEYLNPGHQVTITVVEMTEEEYATLPPFEP